MPLTAPTLDGQQVAPGELPGVRLPTVSPLALGGGVAAGGNAVGDAMKDVAMRQKANTDEVVSQDAANQFAQVTLDHTQGVLSTKGRAAGLAMQDAQTDIQKQRDQIAGSLTDNVQRLQFLKMADQHQLTAQHWMGRHVAEQADVADQMSTRDTVELAQQTAALAAHDPVTVKLQHQAIIDTVSAAGQRQGWDPPTLEANKLNALSGMHSAVLQQMLTDGQSQEAKAYLALHGDEMTEKARAAYTQHTETVDVLGQAQKASDEIMAKTKGDLGAAIQEVQKIGDPKLRQETQQQVEHALALQREQEAASSRASFDRAARIVQDPNGQGFLSPAVQMERANMSPEHWQTLEGMAKKDVPQADPTKVYRLKLLMADPSTREEASRLDLTTVLDPRTPEFKELGTMQAEVLKGGGPKTDSFLSRDQAVKRAYALAGISTKDENGPQAVALADALGERVRANEAAGKKMSGDDIAALAKQMLVEDVVYRKGTLYGANAVPAYQVAPEDRAAMTLPFAKLAAVNPQSAAQAATNLRTRAAAIGLTPDRVTQDGYEKALAHVIMAQDLKRAGRLDEAKREMAAMDDALRSAVPGPDGLLPNESPHHQAMRLMRGRSGMK